MTQRFQTLSPVDGTLVAERAFAETDQIDRTLSAAQHTSKDWKRTPLQKRCELVKLFVEFAVKDVDAIAHELTMQMGRPITDGISEIKTWLHRGQAMLELAPQALEDLSLPGRPGLTRLIRRHPLGVVLAIAPWNYPWLTTVNVIVPALAAGNCVILKHSEQTPLVAERMTVAAAEAGLPSGVFQTLHLSHEQIKQTIADPRIDFVSFTGSVEGGHAIQEAASKRFIGTSLELGGKDAAYVCSDANIDSSARNLCSGAFYNAGQSCCGIERIYVHDSLFSAFVESFVAETSALILGDPRKRETTLGPVVRLRNAETIVELTQKAIAAGAQPLIDPNHFAERARGLPYLAPQILVRVDQSMQFMQEEVFGPVVGIASVHDDEQAVRLINDSRYGLTGSIWTTDLERALCIGDEIDVGTWFMNRCDYLDPKLAWVGVKDSGHGCSLSTLGYAQLSRPQSLYLQHTSS